MNVYSMVLRTLLQPSFSSAIMKAKPNLYHLNEDHIVWENELKNGFVRTLFGMTTSQPTFSHSSTYLLRYVQMNLMN